MCKTNKEITELSIDLQMMYDDLEFQKSTVPLAEAILDSKHGQGINALALAQDILRSFDVFDQQIYLDRRHPPLEDEKSG